MKLLATKRLIAVSLSTVLLSASLGAFALEESSDELSDITEATELSSIHQLYHERITRLKLEILNETQRRTTIVGQLDEAIDNFNGLEQEKTNSLNHTPKLASELEDVKQQIDSMDQKIELNTRMVEELQQSLSNYPRPSMWQAALNKSKTEQQQIQAAKHRYLVHTTEKHQQKLETERQQLSDHWQALVAMNSSISDSINTLKSRSTDLIEKRKDLEQQLTLLSAQIVDKQDRVSLLSQRLEKLRTNPKQMQFATLKKQLPDPIEGTLLEKFAEPKAKGLLKWEGILIEAPLGETFNTVSDGVVVFADEIQSLGNVAIVDHGEGYMSLYGMAELLLVQTDQLMLAGDPIGTVGESVGSGTSALYFEIRHNADTLNPQDWLKMQRIFQKE